MSVLRGSVCEFSGTVYESSQGQCMRVNSGTVYESSQRQCMRVLRGSV